MLEWTAHRYGRRNIEKGDQKHVRKGRERIVKGALDSVFVKAMMKVVKKVIIRAG